MFCRLQNIFKTVGLRYFMPAVFMFSVASFPLQAQTFGDEDGQSADYNFFNMPQQPAKNRANILQKPVESSAQTKAAKIVLSMGDFSISKKLNGDAICNMKFYIQSTMPEKISNISYRLKWAEMETPVIFEDIEPNVKVYQTYALLGKGCYSMDKVPNIIVNRCRIKNISQQACANAITWAK